jgi:outer membrane autotransporter protein
MNQKLQINGSIGVSHANLIDGEKQRYTIDGTAVSFTADKSNTYTTASLAATYQLTPQAQAYANVQQFASIDDIEGTTGNVGVVMNF